MVAVLDAWAILALLGGEPAGPRVAAAIAAGGAGVSWINLGEVYYKLVRRRDASAAGQGLQPILAEVRAEEPGRALVLDAARMKARGGIS